MQRDQRSSQSGDRHRRKDALIGAQLRARRLAVNLTQEQLALLAKSNQANLSRYESGADLTLKTASRLAAALGCELVITLVPRGLWSLALAAVDEVMTHADLRARFNVQRQDSRRES